MIRLALELRMKLFSPENGARQHPETCNLLVFVFLTECQFLGTLPYRIVHAGNKFTCQITIALGASESNPVPDEWHPLHPSFQRHGRDFADGFLCTAYKFYTFHFSFLNNSW